MTKEVRQLLIAGAVIVAVVGIVAGVALYKQANAPTPEEALVRGDSHTQGSSDAVVTVVEFGDYQCPACKQAEPIMEQLRRDYGDRIQFVFRHYPLGIHPNAPKAAEAAEAAAAQGKFWQMHTLLYNYQDVWANESDPTERFVSYAQQAEVGDLSRFEQELHSGMYAERVRNDQRDGDTLQVSATPTFFVNGEKHEGVVAYDEFKGIIDGLLEDSNQAAENTPDGQATPSATPVE